MWLIFYVLCWKYSVVTLSTVHSRGFKASIEINFMTVTDAYCIAIITFVFFFKMNVLRINKLLEYTHLGMESVATTFLTSPFTPLQSVQLTIHVNIY